MATYQHIMLATDLEEPNQTALNKALELAKLHGAKLSLLHIIEPLSAYGYPELADLQSPFIEKAKAKMAEIGKQHNIPAEQQHIEFGPLRQVVKKYPEKVGVDLLIVGSHAHHGLERLLGSGANAIVHNAKCDTLVVRY